MPPPYSPVDHDTLYAPVSCSLPLPRFSLILSTVILARNAVTDEILTLKEVAQYLKLAEKTAYRLAAEGKLPGFKVGGSWRFRKEDIQAWITDQKTSKKERE